MKVILLMTIIGSIMITIGLMGLYFNVTYRLSKLEHDMKDQRKDIRKNHSDIKVIKERAAQESDKIIIQHEWTEAKGIRYPSQEV